MHWEDCLRNGFDGIGSQDGRGVEERGEGYRGGEVKRKRGGRGK